MKKLPPVIAIVAAIITMIVAVYNHGYINGVLDQMNR